MPIFDGRTQSYKRKNVLIKGWDTFRRGLNTLLKENEVGDDELAQADNIVLIGKGVPTKRWGYTNYFMSNSTGSVRGLGGYYTSGGTDELLSVTDLGTLTIKSNASYTQRTGASWASGYNLEMAQLDDNMYIVGGNREMVRYSTPTLTSFPTIATPTSAFATQISGCSGTNTFSYRISAFSNVGETLASTAYSLVSQPQSPTIGAIKVSWSATSTADGVLQGYNIYGRSEGDERFLASVGSDTVEWTDYGTSLPAEFTFPPTGDTTGGPKAKYIVRWQDRLVYAGIDGEPSKVIITGRVPNQERTDVASGGNYILIEPDSGDDITGLIIFSNRLIVFKERSIWEVVLSSIQVGNFYVTEPTAKLISGSRGCIAPRSIQAVENDVFFLSRQGVYVLGYEPNIVSDVIRTSELSAKIRPYFEALTTAQKEAATSVYAKFKYIISFPGRDESMVYDRERTCWVGPWTFDGRTFGKFYDSNNDEVIIFGSDDSPYVYDLSSDYEDDNGTAINTILRTKEEDFGDWTLFKTIKDIYTNWRNVSGTVNVDVRIQDREGRTTTSKSFSINTVSGNAGWGADLWANTQWGDTEEGGGAADLTDVVRWLVFNKIARRIQLIIKTDERNANYELLSIRPFAKSAGRGYKGTNWQV